MKTIYKLTLLVFMLVLSSIPTVNGQTAADDVLDQISSLLVMPDAADQLTAYFDDRVEISMQGKHQTYSRTQAQYVVSQFLAENPVEDFDIITRGETNGTSYAMIECRGTNGAFEINIFVKLDSNRIAELQFDQG